MSINLKETTDRLSEFIARQVTAAGRINGVLGVSGGVDSAVVLHLAVKALGAGRVMAAFMPYHSSSEHSYRLARRECGDLDVPLLAVGINAQVDAYFRQFDSPSPVRVGNKCARERMAILYDISAEFDGLVLGTSNKSEILLGYGTRWGDAASDINPLAHLYKTEVWQLAEHLGVNEEIRRRAPSAELWDGQTDEAELGVTYQQADRLLQAECWGEEWTEEKLQAAGFDLDDARIVKRLVEQNRFKQGGPITCEP